MAEGAQIDYAPEPTATDLHASDDFARGIMGPVGSGKSVACCVEMFLRGLQQSPKMVRGKPMRRTRWAVVRNTYPELKSTTIKTFQDWFGEIATFRWDIPITAVIQQKLVDGTWAHMEFLFLAMDRPTDVGKLKSLEVTGVWLNEASELPKAVLDMATSRVGRYPAKRDGGPTWRGVLMDTNPPDDDHWYYSLAEELRPQIKLPSGETLRYSFWRQPPALIKTDSGQYVPNPDAENIRNLEGGHDYYFQQIPGKTEEWIKVFVMGQYGTIHDGRPCYPEYDDQIHCQETEVMHGMPLYLGWDFGRTPAVVIGQLAPNGMLLLHDELCASEQLGGMGIRQFSREIVKPHLLNHYAGLPIRAWGDPAGKTPSQTSDELSCFKELALAGLHAEPAASQSLVARHEPVKGRLLRHNGIRISPKCRLLRKGFNGGYKFERVAVSSARGEERYKDQPLKNRFSHPHDALQYLCQMIDEAVTSRVQSRPRRREVRRQSAGWT